MPVAPKGTWLCLVRDAQEATLALKQLDAEPDVEGVVLGLGNELDQILDIEGDDPRLRRWGDFDVHVLRLGYEGVRQVRLAGLLLGEHLDSLGVADDSHLRAPGFQVSLLMEQARRLFGPMDVLADMFRLLRPSVLIIGEGEDVGRAFFDALARAYGVEVRSLKS